MSISVMIVEDNPITSQDIAETLKENNIGVTGIYYSAESALENIEKDTPDVLLVDIKLNGKLSGIDLARKLDMKFPIVYLTSNSDKETVNEILQTHPASFLTKPYKENEIIVAIELAAQKFTEHHYANSDQALPFVFLKSGQSFEKVMCENIFYAQADGSYCRVCCKNKEYILSGNLNSFSKELPSHDFLRVHRSFLVNINHVESLDHDYVHVNGESINIGRSYKDEVWARLKKIR